MNHERGLLHRRIVGINNILPLVQHFIYLRRNRSCMPSISGRRAHHARKLELIVICQGMRGNHDGFILKSLYPLLSFSLFVNFVFAIDSLLLSN